MINEHHAHKAASQVVHDFLDLIQYHMLKIEPTERITSWDLFQKLQIMARKCKQDAVYCAAPAPRTPKIETPVRYIESKGVKERETEDIVPQAASPRLRSGRTRLYSERRSRLPRMGPLQG